MWRIEVLIGLVIVLFFALMAYLWQRYGGHILRLFEPKIVSEGHGTAGSHRATRQGFIRLTLRPATELAVKMCNLTRTPSSEQEWTDKVEAGENDFLAIRLTIWNGGHHWHIPANRIRFAYPFPRRCVLDLGTGQVFIDGGAPLTVSDGLLHNKLFQSTLRMADIPGAPATLPPQTNISITFVVQVQSDVDDTDQEDAEMRLPSPQDVAVHDNTEPNQEPPAPPLPPAPEW